MQRQPEKREGRPWAHHPEPASRELCSGETSSSLESVPRRVDAFLHDALTDVFLAAERAWWAKRAEDFERAKPRPGEYPGEATRADLSAQWRRLDAMARACRARAQVSPVDHIRQDVANVLREVAA